MTATLAFVLAAQSAVAAFTTVCGQTGGMEAIERSALADGWTKEEYPSDTPAGFLVAYARGSSYKPRQGSGYSTTYAEAYGKDVADGRAFLIVTRDEPLLGSAMPRSWTCNLRVFDMKGPLPETTLSAALGGAPNKKWRDEFGNEVLDWFRVLRMPGTQIQAASTVTRTHLAGPENLAGLSLLASGEVR